MWTTRRQPELCPPEPSGPITGRHTSSTPALAEARLREGPPFNQSPAPPFPWKRPQNDSKGPQTIVRAPLRAFLKARLTGRSLAARTRGEWEKRIIRSINR